jgi:hypothetical protein
MVAMRRRRMGIGVCFPVAQRRYVSGGLAGDPERARVLAGERGTTATPVCAGPDSDRNHRSDGYAFFWATAAAISVADRATKISIHLAFAQRQT